MYCVISSQVRVPLSLEARAPRRFRGQLFTSAALIAMAVASPALAEEIRWVGGAGSQWENGANWEGGSVPVAGADIVINVSTPLAVNITSTGIQIGILTIGTEALGGNNSLEIRSNGELDIGGPINVGSGANGWLYVNSGGSVTSEETINLGAEVGSAGVLDISDAGTLSHDGDVNVGVVGEGDLNVDFNGYFDATGTVSVGQQGTVRINGGSTFDVGGLSVADNGQVLVGSTSASASAGAVNTVTIGDVDLDGLLQINQAVDVTVPSTFLTLDGRLTGDGDILLANGGLRISGDASEFEGDINVSGNTNAILVIENRLGAGALVSGADASTGENRLILQGSDTYEVAAVIEGSWNSFVKNGTGTTTLSGDNTFAVTGAAVEINGGTLQIASDDNLGASTNTILIGDATLATSDDGESARTIDLNHANSAISVAQGKEWDLTGQLTGTGSLNVTGGGTLDIRGLITSNYEGDTFVGAGTTLVGSASTIRNVVNNEGSVRFVQAEGDDDTFYGRTDGSGQYIKDGVAELILAAESETDWAVEAGRLSATAGQYSGDTAIFEDAEFRLTGGTASYGGVLSGDGTFLAETTGRLTLTGNSGAFAGTTEVVDGELWVNDELGGDVNVVSGGLGGTGTIHGDVNVANNALLVGEQGQVLTITGDVALSDDAIVSVTLGAPGKGDPRTGINDALFDVGGSLDLNGTLQITNNTADAGGFRSGVYRIFDYDSATTLGGNGLSFDPDATGDAEIDQLRIQTSVAGQVNLVNSTGLAMHFWDGTDGVKDDGIVQGGVGTWTLGGLDWAESDYAINGGWGQDGFAVFQGTGDVVSVDGAAGIRASGLQFTVNDYEIAGGSLTLTENGAGFAQLDADSGVSATISASLAGNALIDVGGAGTIILTGDNSGYAGDARVGDGTLLINSTFGGSVEVGSLDGGGAINGTGALGGTGIIDGTVTVREGSRLIGNQGSAPLTMGELILEEGSIVDVTLNAPDLSPGLFFVDGHVTLEGGIINVTTGTGFGRGVYRIIDYTGERRGGDDGLTVADSTGGYDYAVQLADADKQINLFVGSNIAVWNGSVEDPTGGITGGSGTWRADARTNWTNAHGDLGHAWEQDLFAVFQGQHGTVTVDDGHGTISVSGMQFFVDGYTLVGDAIILNGEGGQTNILVGDGTDAGREYTAVIGSELTGDSTLVKGDLGTLILTGENTYTGGTRVDAGILVLGNGGSTGSISGDVRVESGAGFAFNRSDAFTFEGVLSGTGTIGQIGSGTTTLSNDSSEFAGAVEVANGGLHVTGALGGLINVRDGALLDGSGTVGNVVVHQGGTIGVGTSGTIGDFNVGNLTFNAGSTYLVNVASNGDADQLLSSGDVEINGGLVDVRAGSGNYADQTRYTIITAEDGVTRGGPSDGFDQVTSDLAFLTPSLEYDENNVYLVMDRNDFSFCLPGSTANQCATGEGAESTGPGNPIYDAIVQLNDPQARDAFDQTSGELHASIQTGLLENSRFVRDATGNRIHDAFGQSSAPGKVLVYAPGIDIKDPTPRPVWVDADKADGLALWAHGYGSWGSIDGDGNAAPMDTRIGGLFIGADVPVFDNMRLGVVGGYGQSSFNVDDRNSSGTSDNIDLGIYGGGQWDQLGISFGVNHTWHSIGTSRSVAFPGLVDSLSASYDARTTQIYGDVGYTIDVGGVSLEPFAGLAHVRLDRDGFSETGGAAALMGSSNVIDATFATLGVRLESTFQLGEIDVTASGMAGWRHTLDQVTPTSTHAFSGGDAFTVSGVPLGQDVAVFEAGLSAALNENLNVGVSYSGQFGSGVQDQGLRGNLSWKF